MSDARGARVPNGPSPEVARAGRGGDEAILEAVAAGDLRAAISACTQEHGPSIGRLCMAMLGSQVDADDMTQETLLTAHERFGEFRRESTLRAWLLGIARNKCLQLLERNRRRGARLRLVTSDDASAPSEAAEARAKRAERVRALLSKVKPSDRDALLLRYTAELSFKEVAAACGIDEAAARKRVSRALSRLRSVIEEHEDGDV